jgi:hypothetical protein
LKSKDVDTSLGASHEYFQETKSMTEKIVKITDYIKVDILGRLFNIGTTIHEVEMKVYKYLLEEYARVFAKSHKDLKGIPVEIVEHKIDLMDGAILVR